MNTDLRKWPLAAAALALTAACGGGGTSTEVTVEDPDPTAPFTAQRAIDEYNTLATQLDNGSLLPIADADMPTTSTAVMNGGSLIEGDTGFFIGESDVTADFAAGTLSGAITNVGRYTGTADFEDGSGLPTDLFLPATGVTKAEDLTGSLTVAGVFGGNTPSATIDGTLTDGGGYARDFQVSAIGRFYDVSGDIAMHTTLSGTINPGDPVNEEEVLRGFLTVSE